MRLKKGLVARIRCSPSRPGMWNGMGEMDEYVNEIVLIEIITGVVRCKPLSFIPIIGNSWAFDNSDFVKANTIQDLPEWAIKGKQESLVRKNNKINGIVFDDIDDEYYDDEYYDEEAEEEERLAAEEEERLAEEEQRLAAEEEERALAEEEFEMELEDLRRQDQEEENNG